MGKYTKMIVSDIMFVETKNTDYVVKDDGVVLMTGLVFLKVITFHLVMII